MTIISKEPYSTVSESERKEKLAKIGYNLRKNKKTGKLHLVKKRKSHQPIQRRGRGESSRSERDFGGD
ncbi:MAG: hypothetical protein Athens101426_544 [Parcubacteria group bacterium Athens1014_26]|nr:MAG: hypothetical protein Athens101426_544 [Parcubacteria group bacterium Athens1014_26]